MNGFGLGISIINYGFYSKGRLDLIWPFTLNVKLPKYLILFVQIIEIFFFLGERFSKYGFGAKRPFLCYGPGLGE